MKTSVIFLRGNQILCNILKNWATCELKELEFPNGNVRFYHLHPKNVNYIYLISPLRDKWSVYPGWLQRIVFAEKEIKLNSKKW